MGQPFGAAGGAIYSGPDVLGQFGTLTVTNSTFFGNTASNTLYGAAGGGVFSQGTLIVTNSRFFGNSAPNGGGMFAGGATVTDSTFSGNTALNGGGIWTGGGVALMNSTFSGNSAGVGGGIYANGSLTLSNSTVAGNIGGWGIYNDSIATIRNTVVANNTLGGNCFNHYPSFDGGGNLSWPDTSCPGINQDPKLDPLGLQNNGGATQTIALLAGSPAIDAAVDANCPVADQRGVLRPQGAHCDTGAYEYATANSLKTTVLGQMNTFLLTLNPHDAAALEVVVESLANSLDPTLWLGTDGNHLNASLGDRVFKEEEKTVRNLGQLIVDQTQLRYISNLVLADRTLAVVGITDAAGGNPKKLAQANAELANGDASAAASEYDKAIQHYEKAWTLALP